MAVVKVAVFPVAVSIVAVTTTRHLSPYSPFKAHLYIAAGRGEGKRKWKRLLHLMVQH